ncbi:MAG: L,D-transpeptidase [Chloroflexota bacterium]|nr:L,D-transpeptidase [Chloroflexota bacterium]
MSDKLGLRNNQSRFTRREFLKFAGVGLAGFLIPGKPLSSIHAAFQEGKNSPLLGRITYSGHELFKEPHSESELLMRMGKDSVLRITGVTVGEEKTSPNRIWYELNDFGYAHSSRIQPVRDTQNTVNTLIPEDGCLGEVTVPFVKAYSSLDADRTVLYRFYYASTFWILKRILDDQGDVWYQLLDDRNYRVYYVSAANLRLVPDTELTAISKDVPPEDKKIVVDLTAQSLTAYEADQIVYMSRVSSGIRLREGGFATPKGYYRTIRKRPCRHMSNPANDYGSGFDLPGVPWVSYFTSQGVAIHGAYWHNNFGVPYSHGCINMTPQAAKWIYRWTTPTVPPDHYYFADPEGTRVIIQ